MSTGGEDGALEARSQQDCDRLLQLWDTKGRWEVLTAPPLAATDRAAHRPSYCHN